MNAPHTPAWQLQRHPDIQLSRLLCFNTKTFTEPQQQTQHAYYSFWSNYISNSHCARNIDCQEAGTLEQKQNELQLKQVPKQTVQVTHKASAAHLFKGYNQSFPHTQKTDKLNIQRQLFISNEQHQALLTNWHQSEKCVTLTTARPVRFPSDWNVDMETQAGTPLCCGFLLTELDLWKQLHLLFAHSTSSVLFYISNNKPTLSKAVRKFVTSKQCN